MVVHTQTGQRCNSDPAGVVVRKLLFDRWPTLQLSGVREHQTSLALEKERNKNGQSFGKASSYLTHALMRPQSRFAKDNGK
jgi:hypothetical protein